MSVYQYKSTRTGKIKIRKQILTQCTRFACLSTGPRCSVSNEREGASKKCITFYLNINTVLCFVPKYLVDKPVEQEIEI